MNDCGNQRVAKQSKDPVTLEGNAMSTAEVTAVFSDVAVAFDKSEVARRLGVSMATVSRLIARGDLKSITVLSSRRVPRASLEEFISKQLAK